MPLMLFLASVAACLSAFLVPGARDIMLLAGPMAVAALFLLLRAWSRPGCYMPATYVVIDGSNVMHWKDGASDLGAVLAVIKHFSAQKMTPGVIFDANAGYKLSERYQDDRELAQKLGLPQDRVFVVPKGTPADKYILDSARALKALVVTNDRYRDWAEEFPEVAQAGFLIRGGFKEGRLWLDLPLPP
jgi:rRNA-processing protein FCF1